MWKSKVSKCKLSICAFFGVVFAYINLFATRYESIGYYGKYIVFAFFIFLIFVIFYEIIKNSWISVAICMMTFIFVFLFIRQGGAEFLQYQGFKYYRTHHKDFNANCVSEKYHNPQEQTLSFCMQVRLPWHDVYNDVFYDSGDELATRMDSWHSASWREAFNRLSIRATSSSLHSLAEIQIEESIQYDVIAIGGSYYELQYVN